jgi:hypothetical protein
MMKDEATETEAFRVEEDGVDLRERTKAFALRVVKMFVALPPAQVSTSTSQGIPVFEIGPALYETGA